MKIKLPIFHNTDTECTLKDLGIESHTELSEKERRDIIFYHINGISEYIDVEKSGNQFNYTSIHSNGGEYICPLPIDEVEKIIDDGNQKRSQ